jgi:hypothetical protein
MRKLPRRLRREAGVTAGAAHRRAARIADICTPGGLAGKLHLCEVGREVLLGVGVLDVVELPVGSASLE